VRVSVQSSETRESRQMKCTGVRVEKSSPIMLVLR
jgi:hypothetical protein